MQNLFSAVTVRLCPSQAGRIAAVATGPNLCNIQSLHPSKVLKATKPRSQCTALGRQSPKLERQGIHLNLSTLLQNRFVHQLTLLFNYRTIVVRCAQARLAALQGQGGAQPHTPPNLIAQTARSDSPFRLFQPTQREPS